MFDLLTLRCSDREPSESFYRLVLAALRYQAESLDSGATRWMDFQLETAASPELATRRLHIGFVAASREDVDDFWRLGTDQGFESDGSPGLRPQYRSDYYGSFLIDPDGNSIEAVWHGELRTGGAIDHVWIRADDPRATGTRYETSTPGISLKSDDEDGLTYSSGNGSMTITEGEPSVGFEISFIQSPSTR